MIAFDSNIFIYFLERDTSFFSASSNALQPVVERMESGVVSVVVLTEILSGDPRADLGLLDLPNLAIVAVTPFIARLAGQLSSAHLSLRPIDAIHIATAIESGADTFVTNDKKLHSLAVGLTIVPLSFFTEANHG